MLNDARRGAPLFVTARTTSSNETGGSTHSKKGVALDRFSQPADFRLGAWRETARKLETAWHLPLGTIVYVQETAAVAMRDWRIVEDYAYAFGLLPESAAVGEVVAYVRLWDVLRRCCGPQLSEDYRARLYGKVKNVTVAQFAPMTRGPGDVAYDACEMYDIDAVERAITKTELFKRCPDMNKMGGRGDAEWATLSGDFCGRYAAAAITSNAGFNQNPFELGPGEGSGRGPRWSNARSSAPGQGK